MPKGRPDIGSWIFTVLIVVVAVGLFVRSSQTAPVPEVFTSSAPTLDAAIDLAQSSGKPVFAVATADWCPPCQSYKKGALSDPRVTAWLEEHTEPVYINVDESPDDADRLGVRSIPASFILASDGTVIDGHSGKLSADTLLAWLEERAVSPAALD